MGFSCYLCREQFYEKIPAPDKGDVEVCGQNYRRVSATKCGHLFHSDCLRNSFAAQTGDIWSSKACPVCHQVLNVVNDVITVHACAYDTQQNSKEEVLKMNAKLNTENRDLVKRLDDAFFSNGELQRACDNLRREKDDLVNILQQMRRFSFVQKTQVDGHRQEIDNLKNLIIKLTEKLTGNSRESVNKSGVGMNQVDYNIETQQFPVHNTCFGQNQASHPPGLMIPIAIAFENCNADRRDSLAANNPALSINSDDLQRSASMEESLAGLQLNSINQRNADGCGVNGFPLQECRPKFNESFENLLNIKTDSTLTSTESIRNVSSTPSSVSEKFKSASQSPAQSTAAETNNPNKVDMNNRKTEAPVHTNIAGKPTTKVNSFLEALLSPATPQVEETSNNDRENGGVWLEKKTKRRNSSKNGRQSQVKPKILSDRQLYGLYTCSGCKANWGSSHSFTNTPQICRYCRTKVLPYQIGPILSRKQLELNPEMGNGTATPRSKKK